MNLMIKDPFDDKRVPLFPTHAEIRPFILGVFLIIKLYDLGREYLPMIIDWMGF